MKIQLRRRSALWMVVALTVMCGESYLAMTHRPAGLDSVADSAPMDEKRGVRQTSKASARMRGFWHAHPAFKTTTNDDATSEESAVIEFLDIPQNVFLSDEQRAELVMQIPHGLAKLTAFALDPLHESFVNSAQSNNIETKRRIKAIDILETIASSEDTSFPAKAAALGTLSKLIRTPINAALPETIQRELIGEKFDALAAITRLDVAEGVAFLQHAKNQTQRTFLEKAVLLGLIDVGVPRNEALAYVDSIPTH